MSVVPASKPLVLFLALLSLAGVAAQGESRERALSDLRQALGGGQLSEEEIAAARETWPALEARMQRFVKSQDRALEEGGVRVNDEIAHWREQSELHDDAMRWYLYGRILGFAGRLDQARQAFEKAIARDPGFYWAYRGLGTCYAKKQMHEQAIRNYSSAVELNPEDIESGINLVAVQANSGQVDRAQRTAAELLKWHPDDVELWWNLGGILVSDGSYSEAITAFENVRRLDPDREDAARFLGTCYLRTGKPERALEVWNGWLERHPEDWRMQLGVGQLLERLGRNHEAAAAYQSGLDRAAVDAPIEREKLHKRIVHLQSLPEVAEGPKGPTLNEVLDIARRAEEPERRRRAYRTLVVAARSRMGRPESGYAQIISTVLEGLADSDPLCRIICMRAIGSWYGLLEEAGFEPNEFERPIKHIFPLLLAIEAPKERRERGVDYAPVRGMAAHLLGEHGGPWAVPHLIDRLGKESDPHAFTMIHDALNEHTFAYIGIPAPEEFDRETREKLRAEWLAWWKDNEVLFPRD